MMTGPDPDFVPCRRTVHSHIRMTPARAYRALDRRIAWLNKRSEEFRLIGKSCNMFIEEREAIIWMMEKINTLAERLLEKENGTK